MQGSDSAFGRSTRVRVLAGVLVATVAASFFATFAPPAGAIATGPFTVTMSNRKSVRQLFYSAHEAGNGIDPAWTGNIAGCNPGTVSQDFRDATLARINYFRAMAGVPSTISFTAANNTKAQAAALTGSAASPDRSAAHSSKCNRSATSLTCA